jgi:holo-[acyl-carrier protein] synthase
MIVGIGVDIIEIERIESLIKKHNKHFIERVFTKPEIDYCLEKSNASQHFAGKFAAKEAVCKALVPGRGFSWKDIEIVNAKDSGKPRVQLHNELERFSLSLGIKNIQVTVSHSKHYAIAQAITEK